MTTGRQYASIRTDIWRDKDWLELPVDAQWLYTLLLSQPNLSTAGVLPLQPNKWARYAKGMTAKRINEALRVLVEHSYVVVDDESEEVLIRSYIRNGLSGSWKLLHAALRAAIATQSEMLRGVISSEVERLPEFDRPELEELVNALVDTLSDGVSDGYAIPTVSVSVSVPVTTNATTSSKEKGVAQKRATRLPDGWMPSAETVERIKAEFPHATQADLRREHDSFADWAKSCSTQAALKKDWEAAWRNWMRRSLVKLPTNGNGAAPQGAADRKAADFQSMKLRVASGQRELE